MTDFQSSVFQSTLNSIGRYNNSNKNYVSISLSITNRSNNTVPHKNQIKNWTLFHLDPIDCLNNLFYLLAWLIRDNRQLLNYVNGGVCSNGTAFTNLNPLSSFSCIAITTTTTTPRPISSTCPPAAFISPCTCTAVSPIYKSSRLNCNNQRLDDTQLSNVLNAFLAPGVAPLVQLDVCCNQLTQIPNQIISAQFSSLATITLYPNQITPIPTGAFTSSPPASIGIDLHFNKLTAITSGAFYLPNATSVQISLSSNQITSIPSDVFFFPNATSIFINFYSNKITTVSSGIFSYPLASQIFIALAYNQITMLQPGTFQGESKAIRNFFTYILAIKCINKSRFKFPQAITLRSLTWTTINWCDSMWTSSKWLWRLCWVTLAVTSASE